MVISLNFKVIVEAKELCVEKQSKSKTIGFEICTLSGKPGLFILLN